MVLEVIQFLPPNDLRTKRLWGMLERVTGQRLERTFYTWLKWMWQQEFQMHPDYPGFETPKLTLY